MATVNWYDGDHRILWWAVEHQEQGMGTPHPAFYLRALMPGDFGPRSLGPLARHTYHLDGTQAEEQPVRCGTCQLIPKPIHLIPIERLTHERGREHFFQMYHFKIRPWPVPGNPGLCWLCNDPRKVADRNAEAERRLRRVCPECALHLEAVRGRIR